jgi:hypothetical protein
MNFARALDSKTRNGSQLVRLMQADQAKPANCFTIAETIEAGIHLSIGHPQTGDVPSLVLGEKSFIKRDTGQGKGCLYEDLGDTGFVRRAQSGKIDLGGGKHFEVLRRVDVEQPQYALVHVHFGLQQGVKLNFGLEPLWCGVQGGRLIVRDEYECLVELKKGETLDIFYPDGSVSAVHYDGLTNLSGKKPQKLLPEDTLESRLAMIDRGFTAAASKTDQVRKCGQQDRMFHELAAMLRFVRLYPEARKEILRKVGVYAKAAGGELRPAVMTHFRSSLRVIEDSVLYWWLGHSNDSATGPATSQKSGKPAEEKARKADRADRDRTLRNTMKSSSGGSGKQQHGKGNKKSKK